MIAIRHQVLTLEAFLASPNIEESPVWEYIDGSAQQKPMPKTRHSLLQKRLLSSIDCHTDNYIALPELRCTFGGRSIVPDVAVVAWDRIPLAENGEPEDNFDQAPDWSIEILSPQQSMTRVIDNIRGDRVISTGFLLTNLRVGRSLPPFSCMQRVIHP